MSRESDGPCLTIKSHASPGWHRLERAITDAVIGGIGGTRAALDEFGNHVRHAPGTGSTLTEAQRHRRRTRNAAQRKARKITRRNG